jgi:hypothetical protein
MPEEIGCDNRVVPRQLVEDGAPGVGAVADAMDEEHGGTRAGADESPPVPVNGAELDRMIAFVALAGTEPDQRRVDRARHAPGPITLVRSPPFMLRSRGNRPVSEM